MGQMAIGGSYDDPRKLRELLGRASTLASEHDLSSVVVGVAGNEGDLLFPEVIDYFESSLRVDDAVFRMTRERAVLVMADVDESQAREIVERLSNEFRERFSAAVDPTFECGYFEVTPDMSELTVKQVLPTLFGATDETRH